MNRALMEIITNLEKDLCLHPHYTWVNGHLHRKGKLVVGNDFNMQGKLISIYHDSAIEGYSGVTVTAKRLGSIFY
jgi:hypothetical protein